MTTLILGGGTRSVSGYSLTLRREHNFRSGRITLTQGTVLRTYAFSSSIPDYQNLATDTSHGTRLNFRNGSIEFRGFPKTTLLMSRGGFYQFNRGTIGILAGEVPSVGAVSKFAFWPLTGAGDPADVLYEAQTTAAAGGVGQGWGRISATFAPSKSARYIGVGGKWLAVPTSPSGGVTYRQYTRKVQVEKAHVGGTFPSAYEKARQVNVTVKPQRVNLKTSLVNALVAAKTSPVTFAGKTDWARFTATGTGQGARVTADLSSLRTGEYYTTQWEVGNDTAAAVTVALDWCDADYTTYVIPAGTTRIVSVTGNRNGLAYDSTYRFADLVLSAAGSILVRNVMIERGTELLPYFDGSTSPDTIWGGTPYESRAYYYKDRASRYAAIKRILESNVPMGIGVGEPIFGVLPADW